MHKPAVGLTVELRQDAPIPLDANFSCDAGQMLALVGPSGSGKSTILRSIAGIYTPAAGRVSCGREIWLDTACKVHLPTRRRSVGLVFQSYALFPHLTAFHNVMEALGHLPARERGARAMALLARTHLAGLENRRPDQLSGGQQQRVAVARALARDPKVLLLDEPFSAVDQATRERLYEELAALRGELSVPVVLVTHALDEAAMLADRMCVLYQGHTLQVGSPYDVMTKPTSALVANLLALKNIFEAEVLQHDEAQGVTRIRWRGAILDARLDRSFAPGARVYWIVPQSHIVLRRRDQPQTVALDNLVRGVVMRCVALRETTNVVLQVSHDAGATLRFSIPTRIARHNHLAPGLGIEVALMAEGIHLMPWSDQAGD
jgi:molybdate transport system ATP-binding protein